MEEASIFLNTPKYYHLSLVDMIWKISMESDLFISGTSVFLFYGKIMVVFLSIDIQSLSLTNPLWYTKFVEFHEVVAQKAWNLRLPDLLDLKIPVHLDGERVLSE